jgi:hypothetical protein
MAMRFPLLLDHIRAFRLRQSGAALVEFGISLPLILVVAYGTIDSMRLFWSYQAAVTGVREATRYLARVAPADICDPSYSGPSISSLPSDLVDLLELVEDETYAFDPRINIFPAGIQITNVTPILTCETNLGLRQSTVPVATVSADISMQMPLMGVLTLIGGPGWGTINTSVTEQARIYGL